LQKILLVAGARPNFMKIAPLLRAFQTRYPHHIRPVVVYTGQHYDENMSGAFFKGLAMPEPDYNLGVGSGSHARQTADIMAALEPVFLKEMPDAVVVVGDVNSTIAAGLTAKKLKIQLAHVEAGLRSGDRTMPEEINRLATDAISDLFFTTEEQGTENLIAEGRPRECVHFVGNVMIDNLFYQLERLAAESPGGQVKALKKRLPPHYFCLTLHRPHNVDHADAFRHIVHAVEEIAEKTPVVFVCHPRTRQRILEFQMAHVFHDPGKSSGPVDRGILLLSPLGYNDFLYLWKDAAGVLTDSGGLQEETTALGIPCLTLRENTERPITVRQGSNKLTGRDMDILRREAAKILAGNWKNGVVPELWDGRAGLRIAAILADCGP
jgi:UDP-N-acetylglucosamine 2-epimerase (non-hydrolysing)